MSSYDDWKTDPEYGMSHRDLRMAEREAELQTEIDTLKFDLEQAEKEIARLAEEIEAIKAKWDANAKRRNAEWAKRLGVR